MSHRHNKKILQTEQSTIYKSIPKEDTTKITRNRIREIVKETLDKKLVEQEPPQTAAGKNIDRQMKKATGLDQALGQMSTRDHAVELKKAIEMITSKMKPEQAKLALRKVVVPMLQGTGDE